MAEDTPFNPLDSLGPEYGKINDPLLDSKGLSAFEGDLIQQKPINFPTEYHSAFPSLGNLDRPNRTIESNVVKTAATNPSIPLKRGSVEERMGAIQKYADSYMQANQDKNRFAKIYSYNSSPDSNAFYKRYHAYGQETFDKIGFSPLRDNEAIFNASTTKWDDFSRMWTHSFVPLFTQGFKSGPNSLWKALHGDFTSGDTDDARIYEEAAAIGQSNKGGAFGFINNTVMNFGYTAGIISEAIAEEIGGALLAAPTGGASLFATTANNARKFANFLRSSDKLVNGYTAVRNTLKAAGTMTGARQLWNAAKSSDFLSAAARGLNPLENTYDALKTIRQADNITDLAILSKTAGGFYRDVRKINMALSEARLEAGMTENHVYDKLYTAAYRANGNQVPNNEELASIQKQAKEASLETLTANVGLIYASNAITFNNITGSRGGIRNFIKSTTDDIYTLASREGTKNFGKLGKVVYDKTAKAFELQKNNLKTLAKNWYKNPGYKTLKSTVGYFKANFTEGFQENLQEVIAGANEKYFIDSYKSPTLQNQLYTSGVIKASLDPKSAYYKNELSAQFSGQGAETFASGFFMGTLAGPLNSAVPFLSSQWNRIFDKEGYNKWKEAQLFVAEGLVKKLNSMDLKVFMSDRNLNLGAQDLIGKIRQSASKKEGLDAETEAYVSQVNLIRQLGVRSIFNEQLTSLREMDDKEFADALKIDEESVPKYRGRVESAITRLDKVNKLYDEVEKKYPNPVKPEDIDPSDPDHVEKVLLYNAWNQNIKNMVFFHETYDDANARRTAIKNKYGKTFDSINSREQDLLFQPEKIQEEVDLLNQEIEMEEETGKDATKLARLKERKSVLEDYKRQYSSFDRFFNRGDRGYVELVSKMIKDETGQDATPEQIADRLEKELGSLDDATLKENILRALKESHDKVLKTLSGHNGKASFNNDNDLAFEQLVDYYKLGHEAKAIVQYIDLFNNPSDFMDLVRRNTEWMRFAAEKKVKYFEELVASEMEKVRNNAFLNALANNGYYLNAEDMENYLSGKNIPPKEIYNHITKEVYPLNSEEYNKIYAEYFSKRAELQAQMNNNRNKIASRVYQEQIDQLEQEKQDAIKALPTTEVKTYGEDMQRKGKNKSISADELYDQLGTNEYVEVEYKTSAGPLVIYKDANGDIRYDNEEGDIIDFETLNKIRFTRAQKFMYENKPNADEVKKIEQEYDAKINDVKEAYAKDKATATDEEDFVPVTQDSDLTEDEFIDFRNNLYQIYTDTYVSTLSQEEQDQLFEIEGLDDQTFEEWYKKPENKKYFDQYNEENAPAPIVDEMEFTFEGKTFDTKNATDEELIRQRDRINTEIASIEDAKSYVPEDETENIASYDKQIAQLTTDLKNLNDIIEARRYKNFPAKIKEGIRKIKKLLNAQKNVMAGQVLTENDPVTGLKAGQKAYLINGLPHRRVTLAMQDVLGKKYEYTNSKGVDKAFELTIGAKGLTEDSISDFITQLKALKASDNLPGANDKFIDALEEELKSLGGKSKELINLEKEKDDLLNKLDKIYEQIDEAEDNVGKKETLQNKYDKIVEDLKQLESKINNITYTPTETTTDIEAQKADIEIGKVGNTEYEVKSDGVYYQDKKLDNPENKTNRQLIEADIERRRQEELGNIISEELTEDNRRPNGSIGTQGFDPTQMKNLVKFLNKKLNLNIDEKLFEGEKLKPLIDFIKGNKDLVEKIKQYVKTDPIEISRMPDGSLSFRDGNHRANLLNLIGSDILPTIEVGQRNKIDEVNAKYDAELAALEGTQLMSDNEEQLLDQALSRNTVKDIVKGFFNEKTYEDSRTAGNFFDLAKDYLESGIKPKFDENIITKEAYDNMFNDVDGFLTKLKRKVDSGEFYLIGRNLVVYDSNIIKSDGTKDRIAGEIDLLLATEDGIMIVDIKTGETNKWLNFNNLSTDKKESFSKREDYTLQQALYATLLERMIDAPVTGIALLPIQRSSDKESEKIMSASQPDAKGIYYKLDYEKDADGNVVRNSKGEAKFKVTNQKHSDMFIPLYRESVQDKIDKLIPRDKNQFTPGLKDLIKRTFKDASDEIDSIPDTETAKNAAKIIDIEGKLNKFSQDNNVPIPQELADKLKAKKAIITKANSEKVLNKILNTYQKDYADVVKKIQDQINELAKTKVQPIFNEIDLEPFVDEQLELDPEFNARYVTHFELFEGKTGDPTSNQILALFTLYKSGIITDEDVEDGVIQDVDDFINDVFKGEYTNKAEGFPLNMEEVSLLIHEGVKRIQYLKVNSANDKKLKELNNYQSKIFKFNANTAKLDKLARLSNLFENALKSVEEGNVNQAITNLNTELAKTEREAESPVNKKYQSTIDAYAQRINDIKLFRNSLINLTGYTEDMITETEDEGQTEEIEFEELFYPGGQESIKVGTVLISIKSNFEKKYTVKKITKDSVELESDGKLTTISMSTAMDKSKYVTEEDILNNVDLSQPYDTDPDEEEIIKESIQTVDDFVKDSNAPAKSNEDSKTKNAASIRSQLLNKTKDCD